MRILLFLLLIPATAFCQRDFDFTFYTTKALAIYEERGNDSLKLTMMKKVSKEGSIITLTTINNTADEERFEVSFIGWDIVGQHFVYEFTDDDRKKSTGYILINPIWGLIIIQQPYIKINRKYY